MMIFYTHNSYIHIWYYSLYTEGMGDNKLLPRERLRAIQEELSGISHTEVISEGGEYYYPYAFLVI
jgi:hypothetical protein